MHIPLVYEHLFYKYFVRRSVSQATKSKRASLLMDVFILVYIITIHLYNWLTLKSWVKQYVGFFKLFMQDIFISLLSLSKLIQYIWLILSVSFSIDYIYFLTIFSVQGSSLVEWLGHSLAVLGVDGSSLQTASQKMWWFELILFLTVRFHLIGWIKVGHMPHSG